MQRAVALAIIQVYSQSIASHPTDPTKTRPLFFFIDEPEICLHPKAQHQLLDALIGISKVRQIFVSTHSPYLLQRFSAKDHDLFVLNRKANNIEVTPANGLSLFGWSPSLGEINHKAYQMCTIEFHNELYRHIQKKEDKFSDGDIEGYFVSKGYAKSRPWVRVKNGNPQAGYQVTLMTFIRNTIHHPENRENADFTEKELKDSIDNTLTIAK